jgi:hypothetical protein
MNFAGKDAFGLGGNQGYGVVYTAGNSNRHAQYSAQYAQYNQQREAKRQKVVNSGLNLLAGYGSDNDSDDGEEASKKTSKKGAGSNDTAFGELVPWEPTPKSATIYASWIPTPLAELEEGTVGKFGEVVGWMPVYSSDRYRQLRQQK